MTAATSTSGRPLRGRAGTALVALCLAGFLIQLDVTIVNVALPSIQHQMSVSTADVVWVISGYALGLAATIPVMGAAGDRFGCKLALLWGLAWFGFCSVAAALSPSIGWLVAARAGQGVGGGAMLALTLAVLGDVYPPERRSYAIGWWAAIGGTGFGAGPIVGGLLLSVAGWPSVFWINVPLVGVVLVLIGWAVPPRRLGGQRRIDIVGLVLSASGLGLTTYGLTRFTNGSTLAAVVAVASGIGQLAAFTVEQRRHRSALIPVAVRSDGVFVRACLVYFASYTAFSGMLYYLTLMFQNVRGWSALATGLSWLLMNIPFLLVAQAAGAMARRVSAAAVTAAGCAFAACGAFVLVFVGTETSFVVVGAGYVLAGIGFGALVPSVTQSAMRNVPADVAGSASAVLNSSRQLGTASGLALVGAVGSAVARASSDGFEAGYRGAMTLCVVALVIATGVAVISRR